MTASKLKLMSPQQRNGATYEQISCQYLQSHGLTLIAQNWLQPKVGELDLIMIESGKTWDILVFIEVRSRKVGKYGDAVASVTKAKQKKLIKTARFFLQANPHLQDHECRFDVLAFSKIVDSSMYKPSKQALKQNHLQPHSGYLSQNCLSEDNVHPSLGDLEMSLETSFEWIQGAFVATAWA